MAKRTFIVALSLLWTLACGIQDRELLPGGDAANVADASDEAGVDSGMCLNNSANCDGCNPPCENCGPTCGLTCAPRAACRVGLREPVTGTLQCDDGTSCNQPAEAFDYCRADEEICVVTVLAPATVSCLDGRCQIACQADCDIECPTADCSLRCTAGRCDFSECPVPVLTCPNGIQACAQACPNN